MTSFLLNKRATGGSAGGGFVPRGNVTKTIAGECAAFATPGSTAPVCSLAGWKDPTPPKAGWRADATSGVLQGGMIEC